MENSVAENCESWLGLKTGTKNPQQLFFESKKSWFSKQAKFPRLFLSGCSPHQTTRSGRWSGHGMATGWSLVAWTALAPCMFREIFTKLLSLFSTIAFQAGQVSLPIGSCQGRGTMFQWSEKRDGNVRHSHGISMALIEIDGLPFLKMVDLSMARWNNQMVSFEHDLQIKHNSSTAQGGGGSFKNRKPIGEIGCCESGMAERSHWWNERWLELCLLECLQWLQWSPHPQLLDVVWCTATVVVVVA